MVISRTKHYFVFNKKNSLITHKWLLCGKNSFVAETTFNLKINDVTTGKQTIAIHILPNISEIKGNQTMKVGQLMEYNMKNIFLEK